ncbi:hypothetical protein JYG34_25950 [Pseudomonas entomophila]|uniref:hypothetical protein n=1 Tax=Pseudomonas entomophila TaxID=312306 RepID=UPI001BCCCA5A|nr:hypothetical protein [Pseudomonas entomophila]QVM91403.1 hypothetical protein JYG34_25950 [Pseudomonas entomophila]
MKSWRKRGVVVAAALLQTSCSEWQPNTFTLVGELPPNFSYWAGALYEPEPGTPCTVTDWTRTMPEYNRPWLGEYKPEIEIQIRTLIKGCQMVLKTVEIKIFARWSEATRVNRTDSSTRAGMHIYAEYEGKNKRELKNNYEDTFYGECHWKFRTMGKKRQLRKMLSCRQDVSRGEIGLGIVYAAYTLDQLPGKTIKMNVRLLEEEEPGEGGRWVKFPNGWKRCMGKGFEDPYAFCRGNTSDFSHFTGPNGEICTIHPGCKE